MTTARKEPRKRTEKKVVAHLTINDDDPLTYSIFRCAGWDELESMVEPEDFNVLQPHGLVNISDLDGDVDT